MTHATLPELALLDKARFTTPHSTAKVIEDYDALRRYSDV